MGWEAVSTLLFLHPAGQNVSSVLRVRGFTPRWCCCGLFPIPQADARLSSLESLPTDSPLSTTRVVVRHLAARHGRGIYLVLTIRAAQDYVECLHHKKEFDRMNAIMREAVRQEKEKYKAEGKSIPWTARWFYD